MNKKQLNKLMDGIEKRMDDVYGTPIEFSQVANQSELKFPDCPTYEASGDCYYDFRIVYWNHKESYSKLSKTGRTLMPSQDRWASFIVKYKSETGVTVEKISHVSFTTESVMDRWNEKTHKINYVVINQDINIWDKSNGNKCDRLGSFKDKIRINDDDSDRWTNEFACVITSGRR